MRLESPVSTSFRCRRAADSLDIDAKKKCIHEFSVSLDLETPYSLGLIVGASGSGKTSLARKLFGADCFASALDLTRPVIDQFPESWSYDDCVSALTGVGLSSVPCWIRPAVTLSNGQRARAEAALALAGVDGDRPTVIDEWTSVVDRTVAKVMSHCVQKHARRIAGRIVLLSCHYDVIDWLNPDWMVDCNTQTYTDRRALWRDFRRAEQLRFDIHEADKSTWRFFSRYHYLSDRLPAGQCFTYGLFHAEDQVGFQCFANYMPRIKGEAVIFHSNRTVIHPDYAGLGLGQRLISATSADMVRKGYRVMAKFSSEPVYRAMSKDRAWRLRSCMRQVGRMKYGRRLRRGGTSFRENVRTYSFEYLGYVG